MDIDGKKEDQATNSRKQLPTSGAGGTAQQVGAADAASVHKISKSQASTKPVVVVFPDSTGQWNAKLLNPTNDSGALNKLKGQSGGTVSHGRSTKRTAATADQDSLKKAAKLKARQNLEIASVKGNDPQSSSFIFRDDTYLLNSTKSLGVLLGDNDHDIYNSLKSLREMEGQRLIESKNLAELNKVAVDDTSTVCSNKDCIDLEDLNLICSEIAEGLGDGGCDPKCLQTPVSHKKGSKKGSRPNKKKKSLKIILDERYLLEL